MIEEQPEDTQTSKAELVTLSLDRQKSLLEQLRIKRAYQQERLQKARNKSDVVKTRGKVKDYDDFLLTLDKVDDMLIKLEKLEDKITNEITKLELALLKLNERI